MKTFNVRLLAFNDEINIIRPVDVPDEELAGSLNNRLETIWRYGQNDFQPKDFYSVSAGDVIDLDGKHYLVQALGFRELTETQLRDYEQLERRQRLMSYLNSAPLFDVPDND